MNDFEDDIYEWIGDISKEEISEALEDENKLREYTRKYLDSLHDSSFEFHMKEVLEKKGREKGYEKG